MNYRLIIGDFGEFGTQTKKDRVTFTFQAKSVQEVSIGLYDVHSYELVEQIAISEEYRIGDVYSVTVAGIAPKKYCYLYIFDGKEMLDPYTRRVIGREKWNDITRLNRLNLVYGGFILEEYQWKTKERTCTIDEDHMLVYKAHLRGYTMNHGLRGNKKGTCHGLISLLDELQELHVTTIELQPVYEFEEIMYEQVHHMTKNQKMTDEIIPLNKVNYWGYGQAEHFAPKASYFTGKTPDIEMKKMIDAIHSRHMECILEMSFAVNTSTQYMLDVLRFWVKEYHVDGFHLVGVNFPIDAILEEPYLSKTKLFAESFPSEYLEQEVNKRLFIYNDDYLYAVRKIMNHKDGSLQQLLNQSRRQNKHYGFVNYAANSNGFTLMDSFSYGEKHNEKNGEDNSDGNNYNDSFNYGVEGSTRNKEVLDIRYQQMRNAFAMLMLSQGVPLILAGDECANSQQGNNNPYCQDNEVAWVQYHKGKYQQNLKKYVKQLVEFRNQHSILHSTKPYQMSDYLHVGCPDVSFHGAEPWVLGVGEEKKAIGIMYASAYDSTDKKEKADVYVGLNFQYDACELALPTISGPGKWALVMNTATDDGMFITDVKPLEHQQKIKLVGQSISILISVK